MNATTESLAPSAARRWLLTATAVIAIVTYPVVWALGYQDHPWQLHTAADIVAFGAVLVAAALHALGQQVRPPLPGWLTRLALVITFAALASALMWDVFGRPSDSHVQGGPAFVLVPLAGVAVAAGIGWFIVTRLAHRSQQDS